MIAIKIRLKDIRPNIDIYQIRLLTDSQITRNLDEFYSLLYMPLKEMPDKNGFVDIYLAVDGMYDENWDYIDIDFFNLEEFFNDISRIECIVTDLESTFTYDTRREIEVETVQFHFDQLDLTKLAYVTT